MPVRASSQHDTVPPKIISISRHPKEDIMPWDTVQIKADVFDQDSGVENVLLYYGVYNGSKTVSYKEVNMKLVKGDVHNGTYIGEIPPQNSKVDVWYYIYISDKAGNSIIYPCNGCHMSYIVEKPYSRISIGYIYVKDINPKNLTALLEISVLLYLPSEKNYTSINMVINQSFEGNLVDIRGFAINRSAGRFWYQSILFWRIKLFGTPENYPDDWYNININMTFYWSKVDKIENGPVYLFPLLKRDWVISKSETYSSFKNKTLPEVDYHIVIRRSAYGKGVIASILYSMITLVGITFMLPAYDLDNRTKIYLGVLMFNLGFLFKIRDYAPFSIGPTLSEATIFFINNLIVVLIAASVIGYVIHRFIVKNQQVKNQDERMSMILINFIEILFLIIFISSLWSWIIVNPYLCPYLIILILASYFIRFSLPGIRALLKKYFEKSLHTDNKN